MIFWRPAAPLNTAVWFAERSGGGDVFVGLRTDYSEKSPLSLLPGTTHKRGYRTAGNRLEVSLTPGPTLLPARPWFEFAGWILEDSTYRGPGPADSLWLIGGENDDYGGRERGLYYVDTHGEILSVEKTLERPFLLEAAVPSPSGVMLAILESNQQEQSPTVLRIVAVERSQASGALSIELRKVVQSGVSGFLINGPRWAPDDSGVYFETADGVFFLAAGNANEGPRRADRYPACLRPRTNSGGVISSQGRRLYFDDTAGEYTVIEEDPQTYYSFAGTPWQSTGADGSPQWDCRP